MIARGARQALAPLTLLLGLAAGCSNILGIDDPHLGSDVDAGPLMFTGTVTAPDVTGAAPAVNNATVALHREDGTPLLAANNGFATNAAGGFAIPIPASETLPFDGYFEITGPGYLDTFSHLTIKTSKDPHQKVARHS